MKAMLLLLPLSLAAFATGAAADTEICTKQFQACTVACVTNQPADRQDACIDACQNKNSTCFSAALGGGTEEVELIEGVENADDAVPPPMPKSKPAQARTPKPAPKGIKSVPRG